MKGKAVTLVSLILIAGAILFHGLFIIMKISVSLFLLNLCWLVFALLLVWLAGFQVINQGKRISLFVSRMAEGDLTRKLSRKKGGLLEDISAGINLFLLNVRRFVNESATMADKVLIHCEELSENSNRVKRTVRETNGAILEIARDMSEQMSGGLETEQVIGAIVSDSLEVGQVGASIEELSSSMMKAADESTRIYAELSRRLEASALSNNRLAAEVNSLRDKISRIQSIADTVTEISKNTDLLSLNASIEAARAKEAGAGFAVVAGEIRKLAVGSSNQAREIQSIINDVTGNITEISGRMLEEVQVINSNITFSQVTRDNLDKLFSESRNTHDSIKNINAIIDRQNSKVVAIKKVIERTSVLSQNTVSATQQIASASEDQLRVMEGMFESVGQLTQMNRDLKGRIASFAKNYEITGETKSYIEKGLGVLQELARQPELGNMEYGTATPILKDAIVRHPNFELFALMQKDGLRKAITLDYTEQEVYVNFAHRPYFQAAVNGDAFQSEPYISTDTNNYCIAVSVPVRDEGGRIAGILMGDLTLR